MSALKQSPPAHPTMHPAKRLLQQIAKVNRESVASTGEYDLKRSSRLIEGAVGSTRHRRQVAVGLAEFLGTAIEGSVIDLGSWMPVDLARRRKQPPR